MDYEKAYKKALSRAKSFRTPDNKDVAAYIFPELKESEDERIKSVLYCIVRDIESVKNTLEANSLTVDKALAWIEKQHNPNVTDEEMKEVLRFEYEKGKKDALRESDNERKQDYHGLSEFERAIHRGFLCAGDENVPVTIIKETAKDALAQIHRYGCWSKEHYELEEFAKIVRGNLTGISKAVQKLFEAKYLQLTGNRMYGGFKD